METIQTSHLRSQGVDNLLQRVHQSKQSQLEGPVSQADAALAKYETPMVTVDVVVFTVEEGRLKVLLVQRKNNPYQEMWAIPGGFIHSGETLQDAATRRLSEAADTQNIYLEQLYAFGQPQRDPRARVITVAYYALVSADKLKLKTETAVTSDVGWFDIKALPELAFDHKEILAFARKRISKQLETTPIAFQLLPGKFTLTELQRVYELILGKTLDKRNFRKKMLASAIVVEAGETKMEGYHRPAQLYLFQKRDLPPQL